MLSTSVHTILYYVPTLYIERLLVWNTLFSFKITYHIVHSKIILCTYNILNGDDRVCTYRYTIDIQNGVTIRRVVEYF